MTGKCVFSMFFNVGMLRGNVAKYIGLLKNL